MAKKIKPLFIGLYDAKLLGIRYLSSTLKARGYETHLVFLKTFNSYQVDEPTPQEYELLFNTIKELSPGYVGISIMCSFYLGVAQHIAHQIRTFSDVKIVLGGAYATLFPEKCLTFGDVVCRGEGEGMIVDFTDALENGEPYAHLDNVATMENGVARINPLRPLKQDLDSLPHPDFGGDNMFYINNNEIRREDPESNSFSYELTTSRGCPNQCSYCSNSSIHALYRGKGKYIRQRGVDDVMAELKSVRQRNPGLQILRFWDEIFPWDEQWVHDFAAAYQKEIGLPFEIWGHPKLTRAANMKKLVAVGLEKVVIGVQSGSPQVRREIYLRNESQADILHCGEALAEAKVPIVVYDFILGHPFETETDLRETLDLCRQMAKPFRLQLHGLSFLPGTPIEEIAVSKGVKTWEEIHAEQARPLREQYRAMHWWRMGRGSERNAEKVYWYTLIYLSQFKTGDSVIRWALKREKLKTNPRLLLVFQRLFNYGLMFKVGLRKLAFIIRKRLTR